MKVLVDTSIWSVVLRKKPQKLTPKEKKVVDHFLDLLQDSRVQIMGPIRQELISGISNELTFTKLKSHLQAFDDLFIEPKDYEIAAEYYNKCTCKGVQGSHIDFLICAVSYNHNIPIFTLDKDFLRYAKHVDVPLYRPFKEL